MASEQELIEQYTDFVRGIAAQTRRQTGADCELDELMSCGFAGLIEAYRRFDPSRGIKFKSFAYYRVRGSILDGLRKMTPLPRRAYLRMKAATTLDVESEGTSAALANAGQALGVEGKLRNIDAVLGRVAAAYTLSQHAAVEDDEAEVLSAEPSPEDQVVAGDRRARMLALLDQLDAREQLLLRGHYLEGRSLDEIGQDLGISRSAASRAHGKALTRLRRMLERDE